MSTENGEYSIHDFAWNQEISAEELKSSSYYLEVVDQQGFYLGSAGWPKDLRQRTASFVRRPTESLLQSIADTLAAKITQPSIQEIEAIEKSSSSIASRLHPSITLALVYARALDEIKVRTVGRKTSTEAINSLMGVFFGEAMWRSDILEEADVEDTWRLAVSASKLGDPGLHWYIPKINQIYAAANSKKTTHEFLSTIKTKEKTDSIDELATANDQLFTSITQLQRYGLKPCIAPALPQSKTREWLVKRVTKDGENSMPKYHPASKLIAYFHGSSKAIKSDEYVVADYTSQFPSGEKISAKTISSPGIENGSLTCSVVLGADGHLYFGAGQRMLDHLDPGLKYQYEQLRSEIISIYFDSVVPVYVTEQVNREASLSPKRILGKLAIGLKKTPDLRKLVLARQRILADNFDEVELELSNPQNDVVGSEKRQIAKHEVIWHIRRLPPNFRASAEARELCLRETGIQLAEYGETYVKEHVRGSLEKPSKGHKASFVVGKIATRLGRRKNT